MNLSEILFVSCTALLVYGTLGYPVILFLLAKLFPRPHKLDESYEPSVSLLISAHNEEAVIGAKLANVLALDYPPEKLSVVVVSDASTDRTDEIVRTFGAQNVSLVCSSKHRGKTAGLNLVMADVKSDLVIFSDANAMYDRYAIRRLIRHFFDDRVGYVVGHARYENVSETAASSSEGTYWGLEVEVKKWESAFSSVVGGDGAIYAIRSNLYEPLQDTDINDFVNPLQIVAKGYRGVFDAEAWCYENTAGDFRKEFDRKVRIVNRSFNGLLRVREVLNPLKVGAFAWQVTSHKLLRWFFPFVSGAHLITAFFVQEWSITGLAALAVVFLYSCLFLLAMKGWVRKNSEYQSPLFYLPYYFVLVNVAAAIGIIKRLKGETISIWVTARETKSSDDRTALWVPFICAGSCIACVGWLIDRIGLQLPLIHGLSILVIGLLIYVYIGYPLIAAWLGHLCPAITSSDDTYLPRVALLISAYNEEQRIQQKILNSLDLDYPVTQLSIVVASDGSTDGTNEIVARYSDHVSLIAFSVNKGKISAINEAMQKIASEIVVLSDANVMYDRLALKKLVRHFKDPKVGAVSGKVILDNRQVSYARAENQYYHIEHFIQKHEGISGVVVGADGGMYAIRKSLFIAPPCDTILDDFVISMNIARQGYFVLHDAEAIGFEENTNEIPGEFKRKARIIAGGIQCLIRGEGVPKPDQTLLWLKFISHKILRWFSGFLILLLIALLVQILSLDGTVLDKGFMYTLTTAMLIALIGHFVPFARRYLPIALVYYLFVIEAATIVGCYRGLTGMQKVTWRSDSL